MNSPVKRRCSISLPILVIFLLLNFCLPIWAQRVEYNSGKDEIDRSAENKTNAESPSHRPAKEIPEEPEMIDQVGEKSRASNR